MILIVISMPVIFLCCGEDDPVGPGEGSSGSPIVTITTPEDSASFTLGATINFEGTASDQKDGSIAEDSLVWRSDGDSLGTGVLIRISDLLPGTHTITLTATDSDNNTGCDSITVLAGWPDRTEKEDCVRIIELVYRHRNIEKYKELLLAPGELQEPEFAPGYIWENQPYDITECGEFLTYEEDWRGTAGILDNAMSLYLNLHSYAGSSGEDWIKESEIRGVPGDNFWRTRRNYYFTVGFGNRVIFCDADVQFIVGPDPNDPDRYVVYQAFDLPKVVQSSDLNTLSRKADFAIHDLFALSGIENGKQHPAPSEEISWGAVKSMFKPITRHIQEVSNDD